MTWTANTLSSHGTDCKASWTSVTHGTWELDRGSHRVTIIVALPQKEQQMFRKASLSLRLKSMELKTLKTSGLNLPEQFRYSYLFIYFPPNTFSQDKKFKNQNFVSNSFQKCPKMLIFPHAFTDNIKQFSSFRKVENRFI